MIKIINTFSALTIILFLSFIFFMAKPVIAQDQIGIGPFQFQQSPDWLEQQRQQQQDVLRSEIIYPPNPNEKPLVTNIVEERRAHTYLEMRHKRILELQTKCNTISFNTMTLEEQTLCHTVNNHITYGMPLEDRHLGLSVDPGEPPEVNF